MIAEWKTSPYFHSPGVCGEKWIWGESAKVRRFRLSVATIALENAAVVSQFR